MHGSHAMRSFFLGIEATSSQVGLLPQFRYEEQQTQYIFYVFVLKVITTSCSSPLVPFNYKTFEKRSKIFEEKL